MKVKECEVIQWIAYIISIHLIHGEYRYFTYKL